MPWNHRVVRRKQLPIVDLERPDYLCIHEVYFDAGKEGTPHSVTNEGVTVGAEAETDAESIQEMRETLERMLRALDKPIVDWDVIVKK